LLTRRRNTVWNISTTDRLNLNRPENFLIIKYDIKVIKDKKMPQTAIRGIYSEGKIIPLETVPYQDDMNVIIVFTDRYDDESRYDKPDWQAVEKKASEDYKAGKVKSAESIDVMFDEIERTADGN